MQVSVLVTQSTGAILSTSGPCQGDFPRDNRSTEYKIRSRLISFLALVE